MFSAQELAAQNEITLPVGRDGIPIHTLPEVQIVTKAPSRSQAKKFKRKMKKFNKLRMNIVKVLPYANQAATNLRQIHNDLAKLTDAEEIKKYKKSKEKSLFGEYEDDIRKMTRSQGKVLIKLIDRQSGFSTYSIIKDLKSGASAFFWQTIARVFGYNLKTEYDPEGDAMMEVIVQSVESGRNVTYYDFIEVTNGAYQ